MSLFVLGLNHKTAPVEILEKAIISKEAVPSMLSEIINLPEVKAVAILTTCNRCEIYADVQNTKDIQALKDWFIEHTDCTVEEFNRYGFSLEEQRAAQHLARVSCSLEAMMVGETQILGQVKQAYQLAQTAKTLNPSLARLFENTLSISKQVRYETEIAKHPTSFVGAAVKISRQIFNDLSNKYALMVGTGEMIQLATKYFTEHGLKNITVSGRSEQNVFDFAVEHFADSLSLDRITHELHQFDIIISATASLKPIIFHDDVVAALKRRKHRPIFMVDLALPRDIEASVNKLEDVYLYTIENLSKITDKNHQLRMQAAEEAKTIIDHRIQEHFKWLKSNNANEAIKMMRDKAEDIRAQAVQKALKQIEAGVPTKEVITLLSTTLTNKLTHSPTEFLKEMASDQNNDALKAIQTVLKR